MNEQSPFSLFSPTDRRRTVKLSELAQLTGIPESTLREWVNRNQIPGAMRSGKRGNWRFDRASLETWWQTIRKTQLVNHQG
jgi:excisionase family DNA binding protein